MTITSIRACVAPEAIATVTRLFNGTEHDILCELLQNARRAGATRVDITTVSSDGTHWLVVGDDGQGIDDPQNLISLGASDWCDAVRRAEDPAGMGVFALAGRHVHITSATTTAGFMIEITPDAWTGERDIAVTPVNMACGTQIRFEIPSALKNDTSRTIAAVAHFYPLPVWFNGVEQLREDFLKDAKWVTDYDGIRIGVFQNNQDHYEDRRKVNINFIGVTLFHTLPTITETLGRHWSVRLDIVDAPQLKLVLPARKELVQDEALAALLEQCVTEIYQAIDYEGEHSLSFEACAQAYARGIDLPDAKAKLVPWTPPLADPYREERGTPAPLCRNSVILEGVDAYAGQMIARAQVLAPSSFKLKFFHPQPAFVGYEWYDRLPSIPLEHIVIKTGDTTLTLEPGVCATVPAKRPDAIILMFPSEPDGEPIILHTDVYLANPADYYSSPDETVIAVTKSSTLTPADLADLLENAGFCPSDDGDHDSWETQQERFQAEALEHAYTILEGAEAAQLARICHEFDAHLRWHVPPKQRLTLHCDERGVTARLSPAANTIYQRCAATLRAMISEWSNYARRPR